MVPSRNTAYRETLLDAWIGRDVLRAKFLAQMRKYPILLCPAAAIPAFRHGERSWTIDGKTVHYLDAWSYTEWFNLLGNPGAVVPVSHSSEGLPIGVQIVGRPWEEEQVLSVAAVAREAMSALGRFRQSANSSAKCSDSIFVLFRLPSRSV